MLPKIESLSFDATLPVSKKKITYRPYSIKEEKILLIAVKSDDSNDLVKAVKQVVNNCVLTTDFNVENIHTFDLEYILVKLRIVSVSNQLELAFKDTEDEKTYNIKLDLNTALDEMIKNVSLPDKIIKLNDKIGIEMKDITIDMLMSNALDGIIDPLKIYKTLPLLMEHVFDDEQIYKFDDAKEEEVEEFFDSFDSAATKKISDYFTNIPRLQYTISYTNSLGSVRNIELNGLADFFQF